MGPWQRRAPRPRGPGFDPRVAKKLFFREQTADKRVKWVLGN